MESGEWDGVRSPVFRRATDLIVQNAEGGSVERFDMRRIALTGIRPTDLEIPELGREPAAAKLLAGSKHRLEGAVL